MLFNKKLKNTKKEISSAKRFIEGTDENAVISVKAERKDQIFSEYDYSSSEKLNSELADYLKEKARLIPANKEIKIKIFADNSIDQKLAKSAIKANFKQEYLVKRVEYKRNWLFTLAMLVMGLLFLGLLFLSIKYFQNEFLDIILEIISWVFIWQMAESLFLTRSEIKLSLLLYLRLYSAEIEIVKLKSRKVEQKG